MVLVEDSESQVLDIVELLLTAHIYNSNNQLDENDMPPPIRKNYWNSKERKVERPIVVSEKSVEGIFEIPHGWSLIKTLPFVSFDEFGARISLTVFDLGAKWFANQDSLSRIKRNPTLAFYYSQQDSIDVNYEQARQDNKPIEMDREWIHSLTDEIAGEGEEAEDMLKLVAISAPEDVRESLGKLVLTQEQVEEIEKIVKAIQYREYLKEIELFEIGKLLFVGPPGTGKTSVARALSKELGMPFLEVRLSMITSQYLGETTKNIGKVFTLAKRLSPCILFIDEFDYVAKTRLADEHGAIKRAVNMLLKSIDDISLVDDGVLLIGATNHPKLLDSAAWRRFDKIVDFPIPDALMRKEIFEKILARVTGTFDTQKLADMTDQCTGSDLRLILREAVLKALFEDRTDLTQGDLEEAVSDFSKRFELKMSAYENI
ncbi:MAG: ATP-binding protein [Halobacteriota archaeon]|jgi:SpoVK/Ycf46/Vps4 family AAA+-type ATPase|nr:ATP-binding protein [Euryarchaeota archaeon]